VTGTGPECRHCGTATAPCPLGEGCPGVWPTHGATACTQCTHGYTCPAHGRCWTGTQPTHINH
jgi:hypothetical protein